MSQTVEDLRQRLAADPENWQARRDLAEALYQQGDAAEAAQHVIDTPVVPPTEADLQFSVELIATVDATQAIAFADQVLEVDGDNPAAHVARAFAAALNDRMEEAGAYYEHAQTLQDGYRSEAF